jgi:hypothetical protein
MHRLRGLLLRLSTAAAGPRPRNYDPSTMHCFSSLKTECITRESINAGNRDQCSILYTDSALWGFKRELRPMTEVKHHITSHKTLDHEHALVACASAARQLDPLWRVCGAHVAEFRRLIVGLHRAVADGFTAISIRGDARLFIDQFNGRARCTVRRRTPLLDRALRLIKPCSLPHRIDS